MGPFTIPGCFLFKHSLQKRFFYPPLSTAVIFNIKIQNCTCVPFRKSQIRERGTLIGESEKFSSSKGEKSYGRQRGWAKFSEQCGTPRLVVSSDFRTIFLWGAEAASFLINRFPLGGSWASGTSSFRTKLRTQKRERENWGGTKRFRTYRRWKFRDSKRNKKIEHKSHFMFVDSCSTTFTPWTRLRGKSGKLSNCLTCLILIWWHLNWKCKERKFIVPCRLSWQSSNVIRQMCITFSLSLLKYPSC